MIAIGCDLVAVERIQRLMDRPRFVLRVYTSEERAYLLSKPVQSAAGIWAAKEAVSKALGTGFSGFSLQDIEICHRQSGQPYVRLHAGARECFERRGGRTIHLSISHEKSQAMAFAVVE